MAQVLGGNDVTDLTDGQWAELCRAGESSNSDQSAVAQVVLKAYVFRDLPAVRTRHRFEVRNKAATARSRPLHSSHRNTHNQADRRTVGRSSQSTSLLLNSAFCMDSGRQDSMYIRHPSPMSEAKRPHRTTRSTGRPHMGQRCMSSSQRPFLPPSDHVDRAGTDMGPTAQPNPHGVAAKRPLDSQSRERWLTVSSWVRNCGAIILLFVAWQLWGTAITEHHSQEALKSQFETGIHHSAVKSGFTLIPATTRLTDPPDGTVMAQLQIPKIDLDQYVVSGTDAK